MAEAIPPLNAIPIGMSQERQQRHGKKEQHETEEARAAPRRPEPGVEPGSVPAPADDSQPVTSGTLFSASILGQRVRTLEAELEAIRLQREREWLPPESTLRLKDKSI